MKAKKKRIEKEQRKPEVHEREGSSSRRSEGGGQDPAAGDVGSKRQAIGEQASGGHEPRFGPSSISGHQEQREGHPRDNTQEPSAVSGALGRHLDQRKSSTLQANLGLN